MGQIEFGQLCIRLIDQYVAERAARTLAHPAAAEYAISGGQLQTPTGLLMPHFELDLMAPWRKLIHAMLERLPCVPASCRYLVGTNLLRATLNLGEQELHTDSSLGPDPPPDQHIFASLSVVMFLVPCMCTFMPKESLDALSLVGLDDPDPATHAAAQARLKANMHRLRPENFESFEVPAFTMLAFSPHLWHFGARCVTPGVDRLALYELISSVPLSLDADQENYNFTRRMMVARVYGEQSIEYRRALQDTCDRYHFSVSASLRTHRALLAHARVVMQFTHDAQSELLAARAALGSARNRWRASKSLDDQLERMAREAAVARASEAHDSCMKQVKEAIDAEALYPSKHSVRSLLTSL